ncbi:MAG: hypothetical protein K2O63_00350 [Alistipes sp.]|nr:hypothetical protein [Alistipes sp.]
MNFSEIQKSFFIPCPSRPAFAASTASRTRSTTNRGKIFFSQAEKSRIGRPIPAGNAMYAENPRFPTIADLSRTNVFFAEKEERDLFFCIFASIGKIMNLNAEIA